MSAVEPAMAPVGGDPPTPAAPSAVRDRASRRAAIEEAVLPPLVALLLAAVVGDVLILTFGQSPGAVYRLLLEGTWGNAYGFGQVLYKATTLVFTGLAVGLGLRAGLFNIGAESQLAAGGFCAALVGLLLPAGIPALLCLPIYILAAALGGGMVGAVPGVLKARFGAHEVIVTIMLNFIVLALLNYLTSTICFGTSAFTARPPCERVANNKAASPMPIGWLRPTSATAMPRKPAPVANPSS